MGSKPFAALDSALHVRSIGSFHVGGEEATIAGLPARQIVYSPGHEPVRVDPNGSFEVGPMYVQYVRLAAPRASSPLLLMHGGGLCGVCYETTPDGRPGWQTRFLQAGHDVFVVDAAECGRAPWMRTPDLPGAEPLFRTKAEAWELFRIGPEGSWQGSAGASPACPGQRFPVESFDAFMKQAVPRWVGNDERIQSACNALARYHGPFTVIAHSRGCNFALRMALAHPQRVQALVLVEPSGHPDPRAHDFQTLADIPMLAVWGDHLATHTLWRTLRANLDAFHETLRQHGVRVDEIDLPALGVHGNSHMLMMDRNSDEVAGRIQAWLESRGLASTGPGREAPA
jgi:pimeloyl-ACP methyl ester carboxylesterase